MHDRPFLAYHAMHLTHTPFTTTPANADAAAEGVALFPGMVRYADQVIGRLLASIDELGLLDKTIVLLATDNGSATACRGRMSGREVRGGKGSLLETGIHVPLIFRGPKVTASQISDQPVDFTDLLPTLVDLCGIELSGASFDGRSLANILTGKAPRLADRDWAHTQYGETRVVRDRRYKLDSTGAMYDLQQDPAEKNNLAASTEPQIVAARHHLSAVLSNFPAANAKLPFTPRSQSYFQFHPEAASKN